MAKRPHLDVTHNKRLASYLCSPLQCQRWAGQTVLGGNTGLPVTACFSVELSHTMNLQSCLKHPFNSALCSDKVILFFGLSHIYIHIYTHSTQKTLCHTNHAWCILCNVFYTPLMGGARCSSVVRAFAHGVMGRWIDPSWWTQWAISHSI